MIESESPIIVIPPYRHSSKGVDVGAAKRLAASLCRSLFSGSVVLFRESKIPFFKIERTRITEILHVREPSEHEITDEYEATHIYSFGFADSIQTTPDQWVMVINPASVVLRNIDHLFPAFDTGKYASPSVDFLWSQYANRHDCASPGIWAVRGKHLKLVLQQWENATQRVPCKTTEAFVALWTEIVFSLGLSKKKLEVGEVYAPPSETLDWDRLANSAMVTAPGWSHKIQRKLLEAIYLETYLGDESGFVMNIIDS